ncbi:MAG: IMP cyclohydrolase [Methanotrichaceae archaeon]
MYVGRIVVVGRTDGGCWAGYRVSSRSFPNRKTVLRDRNVTVSPLNFQDMAKNPYIAYNCIRLVDDLAVATNGTQTDMIAEKISDGMKPLDAIDLSLMAYGYERDELDTPRIAGVVSGDQAWLGIAQKDEIRVKRFELKEDCAFMVATYEKTDFDPVKISGTNAAEIARAAFDLSFEKSVCSAAAFQIDKEFELAAYNPE